MVEDVLPLFTSRKILPDENRQCRIKQVFRTLRKHEKVGIHINKSDYKDVPIEMNLPAYYSQQTYVVQCTNYPDSCDVSDFNPFNSNMDSTLSLKLRT